MKRKIDQELRKWKDSSTRIPLIVRGARQVGKSYSIESFGKKEFDKLIVVNFELNPKFSNCFQSLDPKNIVRALELYLATEIQAGNTLLFLDEIQLCPKALQSLRYFKEQMPELHVVAAGSLLEFTLEDEKFSFPVGRVEFLTMRPLSFFEYLIALGQSRLVDLLKKTSLQNPVEPHLHDHLLQLTREFFLIGGMPQVVETYSRTGTFLKCLYQQKDLLDLYKLDFGKYAKKTQHHYLRRLFDVAPQFVGKHFKFSKIDLESPNPARDYKIALKKLDQANIISIVFATKATSLPLRSEILQKKFKILFLDIGLLQCALEVEPEEFFTATLSQGNRGQLAEQFVGQELLASFDCHLDRDLFFWERSKPESSSEVDFVVNMKGQIIPIEVKAGSIGRLKSIKQFLELKKLQIGVRISESELSFENNILSVPFYMIEELPRLLKDHS